MYGAIGKCERGKYSTYNLLIKENIHGRRQQQQQQ